MRIPWNKGKINIYSTETLKKMSDAKKGKISWNKGKTGLYKTSEETKKKLSIIFKGRSKSKETIEKSRLSAKRGSDCNLWRGGTTLEHKKIRASLEYRLWREAVFTRDNWTCTCCGKRSGSGEAVILHPDHIKPFAFYPELRFAIDNGRTLCIDCHKKTDTYGAKIRFFKVFNEIKKKQI